MKLRRESIRHRDIINQSLFRAHSGRGGRSHARRGRGYDPVGVSSFFSQTARQGRRSILCIMLYNILKEREWGSQVSTVQVMYCTVLILYRYLLNGTAVHLILIPMIPQHVFVAVLWLVKVCRGSRRSPELVHSHLPRHCHRYTLGY